MELLSLRLWSGSFSWDAIDRSDSILEIVRLFSAGKMKNDFFFIDYSKFLIFSEADSEVFESL